MKCKYCEGEVTEECYINDLGIISAKYKDIKIPFYYYFCSTCKVKYETEEQRIRNNQAYLKRGI